MLCITMEVEPRISASQAVQMPPLLQLQEIAQATSYCLLPDTF